MSEQKHTPGPWSTNVRDQGGVGSDCYVGVDAVDGTDVARVLCHTFHKLDRLPYAANALLIAAAPDILEALQAQMSVSIRMMQRLGLDEQAISDSTAQARRAIAKATGSQP